MKEAPSRVLREHRVLGDICVSTSPSCPLPGKGGAVSTLKNTHVKLKKQTRKRTGFYGTRWFSFLERFPFRSDSCSPVSEQWNRYSLAQLWCSCVMVTANIQLDLCCRKQKKTILHELELHPSELRVHLEHVLLLFSAF